MALSGDALTAWLNPDLEHMKNSNVFDDKVDLLAKFNEALSMAQNRRSRMRQQVIRYYDNYLPSESFVCKIESRVQQKVAVLIISDANVARNASRLNSNSVLIRGTSHSGPAGWLAGLGRS